jgi:alpha-tubulin suppressor-like RCC1 family protein
MHPFCIFLLIFLAVALHNHPLEAASRISQGRDALYAIDEEGRLRASGPRFGNTGGDLSPMLLAAANLIGISAGEAHALALTNDGKVFSWGWGPFSPSPASEVPQEVTGLPWVIDIEAGSHSSFALGSNGILWARGRNHLGQLGLPASVSEQTWTEVSSLPSGNILGLATGVEHALILMDGTPAGNGVIIGFGSDGFGQLAGSAGGTFTDSPVVVDDSREWIFVAAGGFHSLAVDKNGKAWAWGKNNQGQLGLGWTSPLEVNPVPVTSLSNVVSVAAGYDHSLFLVDNGSERSLWASGSPRQGQTGQPSSSPLSTPVRVSADTDLTEIAAGPYASMFLRGGREILTFGQVLPGELQMNPTPWFFDTQSSIHVSSQSLTLHENSGGNTFSVLLSGSPTSGNSVVLHLNSSNTQEVTVTPNILVFTEADWDLPQTVSATAVDDDVDRDDHSMINLTIDPTSDSLFTSLDNILINVMVIDDDLAGITLGSVSGPTTEAGGTASFTVVLNSEPTASVTISVDSTDISEITVSPSMLTFTSGDWSSPQTITVTGMDDSVDDGDVNTTVALSAATSSDPRYSGMDPSYVILQNQDNDVAGMTLSLGAISVNENSGTNNFSVNLTSAPYSGNTVTLNLASSNTAEATVSPASLIFTAANWNIPQTITATGVDDNFVTEDFTQVTASIVVGSSDDTFDALSNQTVNVFLINDDSASFSLSTTTLNVGEEGGTGTFTVSLGASPSAGNTVVLAITSSNTSEATVLPASLTFSSTNWNIPQTVTVTGVDDSVLTNDSSIITTAIVTGSTDNAFDSLANQTLTVSLPNEDIQISLNSDGNGTTNGTGIFSQMASPYTISATPNAGYGFTNWTGAVGSLASSTSNITTLTTSVHETLTANFYLLNTDTSVTTSVYGIASGVISAGSLAIDTTVTVSTFLSNLSKHSLSSWKVVSSSISATTGTEFDSATANSTSASLIFGDTLIIKSEAGTVQTYTISVTLGSPYSRSVGFPTSTTVPINLLGQQLKSPRYLFTWGLYDYWITDFYDNRTAIGVVSFHSSGTATNFWEVGSGSRYHTSVTFDNTAGTVTINTSQGTTTFSITQASIAIAQP